MVTALKSQPLTSYASFEYFKLYKPDISSKYDILTLVNTLQFNQISAKKNATTSLRHVASDVNIQYELIMLSFNKSLEATSFFIKFNNLLK